MLSITTLCLLFSADLLVLGVHVTFLRRDLVVSILGPGGVGHKVLGDVPGTAVAQVLLVVGRGAYCLYCTLVVDCARERVVCGVALPRYL